MRVVKLSVNTKDYINNFYNILDNMKMEMSQLEQSKSVGLDYIKQTIPHNRAGIEMSKNILQFTTSPEIELLASTIISENEQLISKLEEISATCDVANNARDVDLYWRIYKIIYSAMITAMEASSTSNNLDVNFLTQMIPHHEGAIAMAKNVLQYEICPQLKELVEDSLHTKAKELAKMQALLKTLVNR